MLKKQSRGREERHNYIFIVDKSEEMLTKGIRTKRAALNAVASNMIANLSNILPTGFVVHFVVDRLETVKDKLEKFKERRAVIILHLAK